MKDRILQIRKKSGLTQDSFAEKIKLSKNFVWMIEKGERIPSDRTISDICREFSINEEWLRYGTGEMFKPVEDEFAVYVEDLLSDDDNPLYDIIRGIMKTYHGLDGKSKEVIKKFSSDLLDNLKKSD